MRRPYHDGASGLTPLLRTSSPRTPRRSAHTRPSIYHDNLPREEAEFGRSGIEADAVAKFTEGVADLTDGVAKLTEGVADLTDGVAKVTESVADLTEGVAKLVRERR